MSVVCLRPFSAKSRHAPHSSCARETSGDVSQGPFSRSCPLVICCVAAYTTNPTTSLRVSLVTVTLEITIKVLTVHQSIRTPSKADSDDARKHILASIALKLPWWDSLGVSGSNWVPFLLHSVSGASLLRPVEGRRSQYGHQEEAFPLHWPVRWCCDGKEGTGELLLLQLSLFYFLGAD